ncbi:MAG: hypothetical protein Q3990_09050 [Desulfovibrionaceae bacterium]|nr:hypothetical protein [Desulfovibrionaceae bacterium]
MKIKSFLADQFFAMGSVPSVQPAERRKCEAKTAPDEWPAQGSGKNDTVTEAMGNDC